MDVVDLGLSAEIRSSQLYENGKSLIKLFAIMLFRLYFIRVFLITSLFVFSWNHNVAQRLLSLGISGSLENDSLYHACGFHYVGIPVASLLSPAIPELEFQRRLQNVKAAKSKVYMCNVLFPGSIKIAGPDVSEQRVLSYLDSVAVRAKRANISYLILGSGVARRLPDGYDLLKAKQEFAVLAKKMAAVAKKSRVTIILESLNSTETNFINTLKEAAEIVRTVDHRNFRLNADIYHMMMENESPVEIINAGKLIVYAEIAEKENRTFPGVAKDDFIPYLKALKKINFKGIITIEGRSTNLNIDVPRAYQYLSSQLAQVYR